LRGLDYLFAAQHENGGWPMVFPLKGGYYDHITFNDGSMVGVIRLLRDTARGQKPFGFFDRKQRKR
jgi:PelA/Pel-15E family pectate lyase